MNVLSLFDGMSCGQIALNRIGIKPAKYYAAEIDKHAIKVTQANYPDTVQLGDVTKWREWDIDWSGIDLVTGGFPCQAWSMAGKQLGDKDERGALFWVLLDIIKHVKQHNPKANFLIENVKMKKEFEQYITQHTENALGKVCKILINSALVSAQNRNRYYWTSFKVEQPSDCKILLKDVIESGAADRDKSLVVTTRVACATAKRYIEKSMHQMVIMSVNNNARVKGITENDRGYRPNRGDNRKSGVGEIGRILKYGAEKSDTVIAAHAPAVNNSIDDLQYRKLTPVECERLQTVPDNYTNHVSNTQRYKMLGNGWTVAVIAHILKGLPK